MPLIYLSCAWVAGIFFGSKFSFPWFFALVGLAPLFALFFTAKYRKVAILTGLCLLAFFGGALRVQHSSPPGDNSWPSFYNGHEVQLRGVVGAAPEVGDKVVRLRLEVEEVGVGGEWQEASGAALLFVPRYPTYSYGDVLLATGKLEALQLADSDYHAYLASQGVRFIMSYPRVEVVDRGKGLKPLEWVYSLRDGLSRSLASILPEPQAALAQGIILGIRGDIPPAVKDSFSRAGTAHLLAISGLHLGVVAGVLLGMGIWLFGRRHYLYVWLAMSGIWFYVLLSGMQPPVVRGAIMASLFLAAELLGRQRSALPALAFAAAAMVAVSPQVMWTASFQLSFLAMAGLVLVYPPLQAGGKRAVAAVLGEEGAAASMADVVANSLSVTLAAIIAVWPVVAHYFGIVSLVGLPANFFALPALPGIIVTGALAGGIGLVALPVAQVAAWMAWLFLSYLLWVVNGFAAVPLSFVEVGSVGTPLLLGYYSALAALLWLGSRWRQGTPGIRALKAGIDKTAAFVSRAPRKWVIPPLLLAAILALSAAITMPDGRLRVSFLDVGQGDAILISRGHQQVLVDGGPSPQAIGLGLGSKMPFWDRTIELVILTHPHSDHLTGLVEVLRRYRVTQVLYPDLKYESSAYGEWFSIIKEKGIDSTVARAGQSIALSEGVGIEVLNPQAPRLKDTESDIDNNAVVLRVSAGRVSFLLTADIGWPAELELIARRAALDSTVLKVAHHGSDTSTAAGFLDVVSPQIAVISVGADNPFGHPRDDVMERLRLKVGDENIYRTDLQGTIEFITDGERLWLKVGE
ncbi:MAG: ComEC/Rec2 family competence protein [Chloroflexi bacterium]|nr:ComEC/Rec2 family competence protein [Chloroflexota bacterium]